MRLFEFEENPQQSDEIERLRDEARRLRQQAKHIQHMAKLSGGEAVNAEELIHQADELDAEAASLDR